MNDVVAGRVIRALRRRRGWRQLDLATRAGISQSQVSAMERGHLHATSLGAIRGLYAALDARLELAPSWRGADLDRLLDAEHAHVAGTIARRLEAIGWTVALEVTYSEFGERGSIDVLGLDAARRACFVGEVKTAIASTEAVGRKLDEKARLAPGIIARRWGWRPVAVARILVLPETMRLRRLFDREPVLRQMFPAAASTIRAWLRRPAGPLAGTWFLSDSTGSGLRGTSGPRIRVRAARPNGAHAEFERQPPTIGAPVASKAAGADAR